MNILLKPAALTLVGNMNHLKVSCNHKSGNSSPYEDVSFTISQQGSSTPIVERVLSPDKNGFVEIDLFDIVYPELTFSFSNVSEPYRQNDIVKTFTIQLLGITTAETATWTFTAIRAGVDRLADSADNFLQQNFLTWQPNIKGVTYYSPEFLTYYASVASVVKCKARVGNNDVSLTLANISAGRAYTIPVGYAVIAGKTNGLPSYYDVWVEVNATRVTYIQRYYAQDMKSENEQWILFENSLGGIDTFRAYGNLEMNADHSHNVAEIDETSTEFRVDTTRKFKKNTGRLDLKERRWLLDFFPSLKKYIYIGDYLRQIVVTDSDVNYKSSDLPSQYNFTYKYADAKPYLNLPRTDTPLEVLHIDVPEVGSFTVAPRLVEFPRTQLGSGALFPVQDPYSENWGTATLGAIVQYFVQYVLSSYSGGGTFGHVHSNFDFLELLSEQKIREFIKKHGVDFFLSKLKNDTAEGVISFAMGLISEAYTKFCEGADFGDFVSGLIGGDGARIDAHGNMEATSLRLRSYLEVPKLVYNRVDVRVGDEWQTNGAGDIESVYQATSTTGVITLRLLKDEDGNITDYGTLHLNDICKGIFHNMEGYNDNETSDNGKGGRTFAGFFTSYFIVTGVSGDHHEVLNYELRPTVTVDGEKFWMADDGTSSGVRGGFHPCAGMTFAQYANTEDTARQSCQYRTTTYMRMLAHMNGWDEGLANIAFQIGNTPLIASAFNVPDAGRYSMWINGDIFFAGTLNRVDSWGRDIEDFPDQGNYSSTETYHYNDLVHYDGIVWRCINQAAAGIVGEQPGVSASWIKWIYSDSVRPKGKWKSANTPYGPCNIVNLYERVFISKRETSAPPLGLMTDENGNYITDEEGDYIIVDDTLHEDWELLLDAGNITAGEDGQNSISINLTNDTDSVVTDEHGNIPSGTALPTTTAQLFDGLNMITEGVAWSIQSVSGCTATINATTGVCQVQTMTADNAKVVIIATYLQRTYGKTFTFKKLYGKDKMWLDMPEVVYYDGPEASEVSPSSIAVKAYITSKKHGTAQPVYRSMDCGWVEIVGDTNHTKYYHTDRINLVPASFTDGHLVFVLKDRDGNVQDTEDIPLIQKPATIRSISTTYAISQQGTDPTQVTGWVTSIPQCPMGYFLWNWCHIEYSDGNVEDKYSVGYAGGGFVNDGWWSSTCRVKKNHLYRFANGIYVALQNISYASEDTVSPTENINKAPVESLMLTSQNEHLTDENGDYLIYDDDDNSDYFELWAENGIAENAIRIDLDNENDTMVYNDSGTLLSGKCVSHATLYDGSQNITYATFVIKQLNNVTATIKGDTITVTGISSDTGSVVVGCTYEGLEKVAVMSIKRIINADKFDIVCKPNSVAYNATRQVVQSGGTLTVEIWRTPADGSARHNVKSLDAYGLSIICTPNIIGNYTNGSASITVSPETAEAQENITLLLMKDGNTQDAESIPIAKTEDGLNTATVMLYKRSSSAPAASDKPTAALYYNFATGKLYTSAACTTEATTTLNGWSLTIPAGSSACYVRQAVASSKTDSAKINTSAWSSAVKLVENGTKGDDGDQGEEGLHGCSLRISEWKTGREYRNDETADIPVGTTRFLDIVAMETDDTTTYPEGYIFYQCKVTHTSGTSTKPGTGSGWSAKWIQLSNVGPLYATLLIAKNAFIKFGSGNQFVITSGTASSTKIEAGMKGSGDIRIWAGGNITYNASGQPTDNSVANAPYRVSKTGEFWSTNAHITGEITATSGTFTGNITATGGNIGGFNIIQGAYLYSYSDGHEDSYSSRRGIVDFMSLSSSYINFRRSNYTSAGSFTNQSMVIIGGDSVPAVVGGRIFGPQTIQVNRAANTAADSNGNFGLHLSVEGATAYDDLNYIHTGNHALFIEKGNIMGFRRRIRRVSSSQTLSVLDSNIIAISSGITLTLPSKANTEDGQEYWILPVTNCVVKTQGSSVIVTPNDSSVTQKTISNRAWHWVIYDRVNDRWFMDWGGG